MKLTIWIAGIVVGLGWVVPAPAEETSPPPASSAAELLEPEQVAQGQFDMGLQFMRDRKFASAAEAFQKATELKPDFSEAFNNLGISLAQLGKQAGNPQQQANLYQSAADKFSKAAALKPDEKVTLVLWSETLILLGDLPIDPRVRLACYQGAVEKSRRATELAPDDWEGYNKWGAILSTKLPAYSVNDQARLQLFLEASTLFGKAAERARFSGELGPVFANWGSALASAAKLATDVQQKQSLLRQAAQRFERSARAIPNAAGTYAMWGSALIELGKASRLRSDFRDAIDKLNTGIALNPRDAGMLYNLACAYALIDNPVLAVQNLRQCFEIDQNRIYRSAAPNDPDLARLRGVAEFDELLGVRQGAGIPDYNPPLGDQPR
jgi:Flp pilus assembly protein TadD